MTLEYILQGLLALVLGCTVYWARRHDIRADGVESRQDELERTLHQHYVSRDDWIRDVATLKTDYRREQDSVVERLSRIDTKLDRLIERQ